MLLGLLPTAALAEPNARIGDAQVVFLVRK
jgi:hypothetical protein